MNAWSRWSHEDWARHYTSGGRSYATGLTIPSEVTTYHRLWDDYVNAAANACQQCSSIIAKSEADLRQANVPGVADVASKAYSRRAQALATGWNAANGMTSAEQMMSMGDLLKLYQKTVVLAKSFMGEVKRDCPRVGRPTGLWPTRFLQAAAIGQLEAAGIVSKGSIEILSDTATEIGHAVKPLTKPWPWLIAGALGVVLLLEK